MEVTQSNTKIGRLPKPANADLTGKEGYLCKLVATGTVDLPQADADRVQFVIDEGATAGKNASVIPLERGRNLRIIAKGVGTAGGIGVLADVGTPADKGKIRLLPVTTGTYYALVIFEEDFVDGQRVLCRSIDREAIVVA